MTKFEAEYGVEATQADPMTRCCYRNPLLTARIVPLCDPLKMGNI